LSRAESEIDSRPPGEIEPEDVLSPNFTPADDPFADDGLQFDFGESLLEVDDPEGGSRPSSRDVQDDSKWISDDSAQPKPPSVEELFSDPDGIFATATTTVDPQPSRSARAEAISDVMIHPESITPSGRPMSLQPYEDLSFEFSGEVELNEFSRAPVSIDDLHDGDDPDLDDSVDQIRSDSHQRWSRPPEDGTDSGRESDDDSIEPTPRPFASDLHTDNVSMPDASHVFSSADLDDRTPEF
jgi:hypothetical protein